MGFMKTVLILSKYEFESSLKSMFRFFIGGVYVCRTMMQFLPWAAIPEGEGFRVYYPPGYDLIFCAAGALLIIFEARAERILKIDGAGFLHWFFGLATTYSVWAFSFFIVNDSRHLSGLFLGWAAFTTALFLTATTLGLFSIRVWYRDAKEKYAEELEKDGRIKKKKPKE